MPLYAKGNTLSQLKNRNGESSEHGEPSQLKALVIIVLLPLLSNLQVEESFFKSPAVEAVMAFYSDERKRVSKHLLEMAIKMCLLKNKRLPNSTEIIQELENLPSEEMITSCLKESLGSNKGKKSRKTNDDQIKISLLEREHQYLVQRQTCMKCQVRPRELVSLPCGHVTQCKTCSEGNPNCPACGKQVLAEAAIYLA